LLSRCLGSFVAVTLLAAQGVAQPVAAPAAADPSATAVASLPLADALTGEAKESYEAGKVAYGDGDYAAAVLKFQHALDLSGDPRLLWNVLVAEKNQRHYARVEALLHVYLKTAGPALTEADRSEAQALLEAVAPFIANVTVLVKEPDATVFIDDQQVARSPLDAPLRVDMGLRHLRVAKAGFRDFELSQSFAGGTSATVDAPLVAETHEGRLRVSAGSQASIRVDGKIVGLGEWEGRVPSGMHAVEVAARGKQTWRADSAVRDEELTTVLVSLEDTPAQPVAGVPSWIWIAGGSVLAVGLGTGAYFLFKPADKGPPAATPGSLATWELPLGR
jgi:hypothetical protein